MFTFAALIEYSMAAYLEKRKSILQAAHLPCIDIERNPRMEDEENIKQSVETNLHLMVTQRRQRKSSFISKSLNDPKLLEVAKKLFS